MNELLSCDTMVALGNSTKSGNVIFAKNSDRPLGEAQPLIWFPPQDHGDGETVESTYISIPQVPHTYGVLGSRPYWIWGFELGVNERGVAGRAKTDKPLVIPVHQVTARLPHQFYFKEGTAKKYDTAAYAQLKRLQDGRFLISALADKDLKLL